MVTSRKKKHQNKNVVHTLHSIFTCLIIQVEAGCVGIAENDLTICCANKNKLGRFILCLYFCIHLQYSKVSK